MKKILNEWNKYLKESTGFDYDAFIKEFNEIIGNSVSYDSSFFRIVQREYNPASLESVSGLKPRKKNKIIGQLNAGMTHTWLEHVGIEGVKFVVDYKIHKYLREAKPENVEYLKNNFERFFQTLAQSSASRPDVEFNLRQVALAGQLGDWWIANDGLDLFKDMFEKKINPTEV
jgi:hypothetical protein